MYRFRPGLGANKGAGIAVGTASGAATGAQVAGPIGAVVGAFVGAGMSYFGPGAPRPPSQDELAAAYRAQMMSIERQNAVALQGSAGAERSQVVKYALLGGGGLLLLGAVAVLVAARTRRR